MFNGILELVERGFGGDKHRGYQIKSKMPRKNWKEGLPPDHSLPSEGVLKGTSEQIFDHKYYLKNLQH